MVDPERGRAGQTLESDELFAPDIFFLDDGFQHVRAGRDLDIVLLDQDDVRFEPLPGRPPSNWDRIIPAGTWREPEDALRCAGVFLVKCEPEDWPSLEAALELRLREFPRPVFAVRMAGLPLEYDADFRYGMGCIAGFISVFAAVPAGKCVENFLAGYSRTDCGAFVVPHVP